MGRISVSSEPDVWAARRHGRDQATRVGFQRVDAEEVVLVVSELATNIVKYGRAGAITIEEVEDMTKGRGLSIVATDRGPPFRSLDDAIKDGWTDEGPIDPALFTTRRGIG